MANKKTDRDKSEVYLRVRVPAKLKEDFKKYCSNNNKDMSEVIKNFMESCVK